MKFIEDTNVYLEVPSSPGNSFHYLYGDHDHYLDANHSQCHSSAPSPYMTFSSDFPGTTTAFSTPDSRDASSEDASAAIEQPEAAAEVAAATTKRKRENRYKNAPPSVLSRRRAQNRASQRAYRERKDQRIKDLEQKLREAQERIDVLSREFGDLQAEYTRLLSSSSSTTTTASSVPQQQNMSVHHRFQQLYAPTTTTTSSHHHQAAGEAAAAAKGAGGGGYLDAAALTAVLGGGSGGGAGNNNGLDAYLYSDFSGYGL